MHLFNLATAIVLGSNALAASAQIVVAHFMAQNAYSYSQSDWQNDMTTAKNIGIDGFVLNTAAADYEVDRIDDAFTVAENLGFKLFLSFDMSYSWAASDIVSITASHASSSAMLTWNGKVLLSTYSGESYGDSFWSGIKSSLANEGIQVSFAPAFTTYRDPSLANSLISTFSSVDGFFNWWSWPDDVGTLLTTDTDLAYQSAIKDNREGPYIMGVSPWQFKDIDGTGDNWVELSDTLWMYRWQQAIDDVKPDIVEIITWNDYAESHYIGDINPNVDLGTAAPNYVNGFVHAPWRIVAQYYISWYKTGSAPAVTDDTIVFWYRSHPKDVTCSGGWPVRNSQYPADAVFALALLSSPATVSLDIGSTHAECDNSPAGASMCSVAFPVEDAQIPYIQIIRNGVQEKYMYGSIYVTQSCDWYNFNPFVGVVQ
ncbi:hypothetical protein HMN09_00339900 [Mycena chlorophos]|uniref:Glycoside hydrolase family 71 protein n=1 Tax=Mycena chlorophos TaxID=658473 RepID=A0A8H6TKF6_MYCCL|nr:hypothetical protein HMN09_00339900 [Mycena chlorophos]